MQQVKMITGKDFADLEKNCNEFMTSNKIDEAFISVKHIRAELVAIIEYKV